MTDQERDAENAHEEAHIAAMADAQPDAPPDVDRPDATNETAVQALVEQNGGPAVEAGVVESQPEPVEEAPAKRTRKR